jgi:P27 family predicted phage terminase small subunit
MKGRNPIPFAVKRAEGNRGKRKDAATVTTKPAGIIEPPKWMGDEGKAEWARWISDLDGRGMLDKLDRSALENLCSAYDTAVKAEKVIAEHGNTRELKQWDKRAEEFVVIGEQTRAEVAIRDKAWARHARLVAEFAGTLASRSRIRVSDAGREIDPLESALA